MVRSMFSGVAGMKAHQTRMDVIGNNIANVNTYGFKSSRATFRDVYYQTMRSAAAGTGTRGGLNPSQVGYGSTIGSIDVMQSQSSMSTTGNPLDIAITGEGFLQVQDSDGNIFYTKAGMLDIDSYGNLIDVNGNFVLGVSGSPVGQAPDSKRITFTIPPVDEAVAKGTVQINGVTYTLKATNTSEEGNVKVQFTSGNDLTLNQRAKATVMDGNINVMLNPKAVFTDINDLNSAINDAIKEANGGAEHPAGKFTLSTSSAAAWSNLTGEQILGKNYGADKGTLPTFPNDMSAAGFDLTASTAASSGFTGTGTVTYKIAYNQTDDEYTISADFAGPPPSSYSAKVNADTIKDTGGKLDLQKDGSNDTDYFTIEIPNEAGFLKLANQPVANPPVFPTAGWAGTGTAAPSTPSKDLGLSSDTFKLVGGTKGGPQTVKNLSSIAIGSDGVIIAVHPVHGEIEVGRIDLATFDNPAGLAQSGNTYFTSTANSGTAHLASPGEDGTGMLAQSALEMSNVDLSQEFADMITTQRGFQANSRLITVSDTMLEELINLKR